MKKFSLKGQARELYGRKVKQLRAKGMIPATVYGKHTESVSLALDASLFEKIYAQAGETGLVELSVDDSVRPTLIHNVQRHPTQDVILHVEFYQVDLKEKVHAKVPVVANGESPAVAEKKGVLLMLVNEVEVEALPTDLPEKLEVDVTSLTDVDQEIKVSDLKVPTGVTVLSDAELGVVKVAPLVSKEAEEQAAADAAAAAAASETPTEGTPAEEKTPAATPESSEKASEDKE